MRRLLAFNQEPTERRQPKRARTSITILILPRLKPPVKSGGKLWVEKEPAQAAAIMLVAPGASVFARAFTMEVPEQLTERHCTRPPKKKSRRPSNSTASKRVRLLTSSKESYP